MTVLTLCSILLRDCIKCKHRVYVHCALEVFILHANIAPVTSFECTDLSFSSLERKIKKSSGRKYEKKVPTLYGNNLTLRAFTLIEERESEEKRCWLINLNKH